MKIELNKINKTVYEPSRPQTKEFTCEHQDSSKKACCVPVAPDEAAVGTYQQWCLLALPVTTLLRQQSSLLQSFLLPWLLCLDFLKKVKDRDQKDGPVGRALTCNLMNGV